MILKNLDTWTSAIKAKSSAGRGSGKKQEFYGIKKLRELILELAVRGLLVPQDPNDEPASELLKKILSKRSMLIKEGKLKKQKKLLRIADYEKPFGIPLSWEWIRLGEATNYGVCDKTEASDVNEETWVLELEDVERSTSKLLKKVRFCERNFRSSKNRFSQGDVIYGKLRPYLDKVLIADEPGVCTTEMIPITPYSSISPEFLRLLMKAPYFIRYANNSTHGMNLPRMGTDLARAGMIPLAPESEQHRIVAKVDELMALCDQLEQQQEDSTRTHAVLVETLLGALTTASDHGAFAEAWQHIASHFDTLFTTESSIEKLKQTILQLAVMGKLVPRIADEGKGSEVLHGIKDLELHDNEGPSLPDHWTCVSLGSITTLMNSGWSPACNPEPADINSWGVLKTTAVQVLEYLEFENKRLPSSLKPRPENEVMDGDILFTRAGPMNRVGILCVARPTRPKLMLSDKIIRFHLIPEIDPDFAALSMSAGYSSRYIEELKSGMAASQVNISQPKLRSVPVPIPPLAEQHRIVAKVDELMALCDRLKARLQSAQATQLHLADTLVQQAI